MKREEFKDQKRYHYMGSVFISDVFVPGQGSPEVKVFLDQVTGIAYQVFNSEYGELFRKSSDEPGENGLHHYEEWQPLQV